MGIGNFYAEIKMYVKHFKYICYFYQIIYFTFILNCLIIYQIFYLNVFISLFLTDAMKYFKYSMQIHEFWQFNWIMSNKSINHSIHRPTLLIEKTS